MTTGNNSPALKKINMESQATDETHVAATTPDKKFVPVSIARWGSRPSTVRIEESHNSQLPNQFDISQFDIIAGSTNNNETHDMEASSDDDV